MTEEAIQLDPVQERAVELMCTAPVAVITGGPGTGKTCCVRYALARMRQQAADAGKHHPHILLTAPTGKAASRLRDSTGEQAGTLHRMFGIMPGSEDAPFYDDGPPVDVVIIDESSMVDTALMAAVMRKIDLRRTRVIFVGDPNQLPSVGPGQVLLDIIDSNTVPVIKLETLHRAAQESWICRNAPRILRGQLDDIDMRAPDFRFVKAEAGKLADVLVDVYEDELNWLSDHFGRDASLSELLEHSQILVPMKVGSIGAEALNDKIQRAILGEQMRHAGYKVGERAFWDGDKIIQTKNNYAIDVMNGETGYVLGSSGNGKFLDVTIDQKTVHIPRSHLNTFYSAYAITVHRSQGSQWPLTIVVCHSAHGRMLARRLFYTAVTRASKRVVIVGDDDGFERAVKNDVSDERRTNLGNLLAMEAV